MSFKHFVILLVFIEYFVSSYGSINYCDPELCSNPLDFGLRHIACSPFSEFGASCDSPPKVNEIKADTRFSIVRMHNKLRHNVASGNLQGYRGQKLPKAIKMAHMVWDDELATLALLSALQCKDAGKFCVNTYNYRASGQMIITSRNSTSNPSLQFLRSLKRIGKYGELMDPTYIQKYPNDSIARNNGFYHFAILIIDHNNRIGCASVTTEHESYFVCHYASRNMPDLRIYETGEKTASACTKQHPEFCNLCESTTEIDPNVNFKEALKLKDREEELPERITPKDEVEPGVNTTLPSIQTTAKTLTPSEMKAKEEQLVTTTARPRPATPPTGDDYSDEDENDIGPGYGTPQEYNNDTLWVYLEKKKSKLHSCDVKLCEVAIPLEPLIQTTCNFSLSFGGNCPKTTKAHIFSDEEKDTVVDIINTYRNSVAGGEVVGRNEYRFPKATRMAYTKWDDELAALALLDGKDCGENKAFRVCGNSKRYRNTGKIYYLNTVSSAEKSRPRMNLQQAFEKIFEHRIDVAPDMIFMKLNPTDVIEERNFLEMFTDHSTRIGCSVVMWEDVSGPRYEFLICYTSSGTIPIIPIYSQWGESASDCVRKHFKFPNLCAEDEEIDPNEPFKEMKYVFDNEFYKPESFPKVVERITNRRNYCEPSLCESGEKHVACKATETFSPSCSSNKMIAKFTDFTKSEVLDNHNHLRNLAAEGNVGEEYPAQIPKAVRMAYMQWDDELSDLALLDVIECADHKKSCHNTPSYKASGQNVFRLSFKGYITQDYCMFMALISWDLNYTKTNWHQFVQKFSNDTPTWRELENFALLVIDKNNRVGCAMSIYVGNDNVGQCYVVCNYATKLYNSLPVYKTGNVVASECTRTHKEYSNLCAEDEPINPNNLSDITLDLKPIINKNQNLDVHLGNILKPKSSTNISDILKPIVNRTQYCDPNLCRKGTHIGCNNTATAGDTCGKVKKLIIMTPERIDIILKTHNELRNLTAGGDAPGSQDQKLPKAVRMGRMQWDQELADLALLNAKTCVFAHDTCRNTEKYKMSGQNIAQFMSTHALDPNIYLKKSVNNWFSESSRTTADHITSYPRGIPPNKPIGHFTQVVNDKSTRVGCAAIIFNVQRDGRLLETLQHVCNYARTNLLDKPVYTAGNESASQCKAKDNVYVNLCHESEDIDPNEGLVSPQKDTLPSRGDLDDFDESYDNGFGMTAPPGFLFEPISPKTDDKSDTPPPVSNLDDYLSLFELDWNKPYPEDEITMPPFSFPTFPTYTTQNIHELLPHSVTEESITTESFTTPAIQTTPHSVTEEPTTVAIPTEADIQSTPHSVAEEPTTVAIPIELDSQTTPQSVTEEPTTVAIPTEADIQTTPHSVTEKPTTAAIPTETDIQTTPHSVTEEPTNVAIPTETDIQTTPHSVTEEPMTTVAIPTETDIQTTPHSVTEEPTTVAIPTEADIQTTPQFVTEEPITTVAIPTEADIQTTPQSVTEEPITTVAIPTEADIETTPHSVTEEPTTAAIPTEADIETTPHSVTEEPTTIAIPTEADIQTTPHSATEEPITTVVIPVELDIQTTPRSATEEPTTVAIPTEADIQTTPQSVTEEPITTVAIPTEADIQTTPHSVTEEPTTVAIPTEADIETTPHSVPKKTTEVPVTTNTTEREIHVPRIGATEEEEQTTPVVPSSSTTPKTPKQVDDMSGGHTRPRPSKPRRPLPNEDDYFIIRSSNPVYDDDDDDDGILIMS